MRSDRTAIIIGGGITGTLSARELALAGWKVTLLEGRTIGAGSSSRTAAGIRQQFSTPETVRGMRYSVRFYRNFAEEVEDGTCPIIQSGYLFLYSTEDGWRAAQERVQMQHATGLVEVEALSAAAVHDRFCWVDPQAITGGTHCPTDGFLLPSLIYQEATRRARQLGATVVQNAPVTGAEVSGSRITAVHTPKGAFSADVIVDCTNAWTKRLGAVLGGVDLPVEPLKRYLWFLARGGSLTADDMRRMPLTIAQCGIYCRPENTDTLMMGRAHATAPEPAFSYEDQDVVESAFAHNTGLDAAPFQAWMELAEVLPPIGEFDGITATTAGFYGTTPDHNPFYAYDPLRSNLVRMVGFSGHGAMFGPFSARVALALCEAGHDVDHVDLDGEAMSIEAFRIGRDFSVAEAMVI